MVQGDAQRQGRDQRLKIDPSLVDPNEVEVLEDLIVAAFNDAKPQGRGDRRRGDAEADRRPEPAPGLQAAVLSLRTFEPALGAAQSLARKQGRAAAWADLAGPLPACAGGPGDGAPTMSGPEIERLIRAAGAAAGPGPALGAARGAAPDEAARAAMLAAGRGAAGGGRERCATCCDLRQPRHPRSLRDLPRPRRDAELVCVVEDVADLWALERAGAFRGRYHVLGGMLSALDGIGRRPAHRAAAGPRAPATCAR